MDLERIKHEERMKENYKKLKNEQMVLFCLSIMYKSGADVVRDVDGGLLINDGENIPSDCLKVAESIFDFIDKYIKSVDEMSNQDKTVHKMMLYFLGWKTNNDAIKNFMIHDDIGFNIFNDYQIELMKNGWTSTYTDYRLFENEKSKVFKDLLIKQLIQFGKGGK